MKQAKLKCVQGKSRMVCLRVRAFVRVFVYNASSV